MTGADACLEEDFLDMVSVPERDIVLSAPTCQFAQLLPSLNHPAASQSSSLSASSQLIASERVPALVDNLSNAHLPFTRRKTALAALAALVAERPGYAVEAAAAGAPAAAAALLALPAARAPPSVSGSASAGAGALDDTLADLVSAVVAACGGELAAAASVRSLAFPSPSPSSTPHITVAVAQGSLADGIGARLWASAAAMGRALVDPEACLPPAVGPLPAWGGGAVLELGAGVGLVGVLVARLPGAGGGLPTRIDLTDGDEAALATLRRTLAANAESVQGADGNGGGGGGGCWEAGRVRIRRLVWAEASGGNAKPDASCPKTRGCTGSLTSESDAGATTTSPPLCPACSPTPPSLPPAMLYGAVLAADCLYEPEGAVELAEELCARLDPALPGGGCALLAGPVRDGGETLAAFVGEARRRGAEVVVVDAPDALAAAREAGEGVAGRAGEYDRFVFIRVQAPARWGGVGGPRGAG
jgi:hypothetical protein